ncbi:hypothetical protein ZWY2020_037662 [Hordeum vulgare]|nr:hypothetical protein ZWY2020_037662 [Hordeum vulgare]
MALYFNELTGSVPPEVGTMSLLQGLDLNDNQLEGELPAAISSLKDLYSVDFSNNKFTGTIPSIGSKKLLVAAFANNSFSGSFPRTFCDITSLEMLDLSGNQLWDNKFTGGFPAILKKCKQLIVLDIGHIPQGLLANLTSMMKPQTEFNLTSLVHHQVLNLDAQLYIANRIDVNWKMKSYTFQGTIALMIGAIPSSISKLASLSSLNLSNNNLSGEIPTGNQLQTLDDPSIYNNNSGLCGFR